MGLERRKTKNGGVTAEENQERRYKSGGKPRKVGLQQRKTKNSEIRDEEIQEKQC